MGWDQLLRCNRCVRFQGYNGCSTIHKHTQKYLIPFIRNTFLNGHKFQQDNDLKHTSHYAQMFFAENQINWWKSPPESPDANLIENLWHELNSLGPKFPHIRNINLRYICNVFASCSRIVRASATVE